MSADQLAHSEELIPGLVVGDPPPGARPGPDYVGPVTRAARATVKALHSEGALTARQAVAAQTLLTLAQQLDRAAGDQRAKDYGVANLAQQIQNCYQLLNPEEAAGIPDAFADLAAQVRDAARRDAGMVP